VDLRDSSGNLLTGWTVTTAEGRAPLAKNRAWNSSVASDRPIAWRAAPIGE
jgi:hypothetical protein